MGHGSWSDSDFASHSRASGYASKSTNQLFTARRMDPSLDPRGVMIRESRDSVDNPLSTPIILGLDVTGSMGAVAGAMAKEGLNSLCKMLYERKPVTDPHIMCMGIGDLEYDSSPLQVSQFEADLRILTQLELLFLEGGGGGNSSESYTLPWYFAANHTVTDSFVKRGKKGYLFTFGDEEPNPTLNTERLTRTLGHAPQGTLSASALLREASKTYQVFHLMVAQGSHYITHGASVRKKWADLMGQRAIVLQDHKQIADTIFSIIHVNEGGSVGSIPSSVVVPPEVSLLTRTLDLG
jgi:hypothetical protein